MLDVKKLITGFLVLAAAASSSALILSNIGSGANATATNAALATVTATSSPAVTTNAFAPTDDSANSDDPATLLGYQASSTVDAIANDPNNLTNALSQIFLNNIVAANPNGTQTDESGNLGLAQPDNASVLAQLSGDHVMNDISIPNWDIEATAIKLNITQDSSPTAMANYSTALQNLFNQYFITTDLESMADSGDTDSADPNYVSAQIQSALQAAVNIKTPLPAADFQKSLVRILIYEKNMLALANDSTNDPVKNSLILQAEEQNYNIASQEMETETQKLSTLSGISFGNQNNGSPNETVAFLNDLMGVKTAHALFGVGDFSITFNPSAFAQWVEKLAEDTALQIVKNALTALIQKEVLTWIQGSGAPRFVQNWATASVNAYQSAALTALNAQFQCVGSAQLPVLKVLLATPNAGTGNNVCANQFNSQLNNNLSNLSNRLTNWNNYFALYQPGGNAWGNLITIQDNVAIAANQSAVATQAKNVASQGFTGSETCADGSNPNGQSIACFSSDGYEYYPNAQGQCTPPDIPKLAPNNGICGNGGDPQLTMPGTVATQGFGVGLATGKDNITAATTIVGLLSSLTSSLLNSLASAAISYSNHELSVLTSPNPATGNGGDQVSDGGTLGIATSSIGDASSTPSEAGTPVQCSPSDQQFSLSASGGQVTTSLYGQGGVTDITCVLNGDCPPSEGSDGSPTYSWTASPSDGVSMSGGTDGNTPLTVSFNATGTYYLSVVASTDNTNATCEVDVSE